MEHKQRLVLVQLGPDSTCIKSDAIELQNVCSVKLLSYEISGNVAAFPPHMSLYATWEATGVHSIIQQGDNTSEQARDNRVMIFPSTTPADSTQQPRELAYAALGTHININSQKLRLEVLDVPSGTFIPFTDYTAFVFELEIIGRVYDKTVRRGVQSSF